jgi:hypothetical protein
LNKEEQTPTSPALSYIYGERPNQNRDIDGDLCRFDSISLRNTFGANQTVGRNTRHEYLLFEQKKIISIPISGVEFEDKDKEEIWVGNHHILVTYRQRKILDLHHKRLYYFEKSAERRYSRIRVSFMSRKKQIPTHHVYAPYVFQRCRSKERDNPYFRTKSDNMALKFRVLKQSGERRPWGFEIRQESEQKSHIACHLS